jgi:nitric oxide reductase subunit B
MGEDILAGQQVFLKNGLMEYGSIFGHGAYLGPDFTADYLRRAATMVASSYGSGDQARSQTADEFKANRFDKASNTLTFTRGQADAYSQLVPYYHAFFSEPSTRYGLPPSAISDPTQTRQLTAFFSWSAWVSAALRPGHNYSYTNNWPPEPLVNNSLTADMVVWSVLSLAALLGGTGVLLAAFGRWNFLGWHGRERQALTFRAPGSVVLTPAQRVTAWFFFVMALLFLIVPPKY